MPRPPEAKTWAYPWTAAVLPQKAEMLGDEAEELTGITGETLCLTELRQLLALPMAGKWQKAQVRAWGHVSSLASNPQYNPGHVRSPL